MTDAINTNQTRVYALSGQNGYISNSYTSAPLTAFSWVLDPAAGATKSPPTANTAATPWKLADLWHAEINFRAYCRGYFIDTEDLTAALAGLDRLGTTETPPQKLLNATQIHIIVTRLFEYTSTNGSEAEGMIEKFLTRLSELKLLLDGGFSLAASEGNTAFYAGTTGTANKDAAFENYASRFFLRAKTIYADNLEISGASAETGSIPGSTNLSTTSLAYSGGVEATAKAALKVKFDLYFETSADTGVRTLNKAKLTEWLSADLALITTDDKARAYDPAPDVALMAQALTLPALGGTAAIQVVPVTAAAVAAKKAEVESLGAAVDRHYETLASNTNLTLERILSELLEAMNLKSRLPEIVSRVLESRFIVTTWITAWGEESSPSLPSDMLELDQNDVGVVSRPTPPENATELGIVGWRAYRSNAGAASAAFQMVPSLALLTSSPPVGTVDEVIRATYKEINRTGWLAITDFEVDSWKSEAAAGVGTGGVPWTNAQLRTNMLLAVVNPSANPPQDPMVVAIAQALLASDAALVNSDGSFNCFKLSTLTHNDAAKSAQLQESLATTTWLPPPSGLRGITDMANGITAGFVGNAVYFSEPYVPYAWPYEYRVALDYPVVAIAAFGNTLFVGTRGSVYLISGSDPASMSAPSVAGAQVCISARSVVSADQGVVFASAKGICLADAGGVRVVTKGLFTRETWSALNPETIVATMHDGVYYFQFTRSTVLATGTRAQVVEAVYKEIGRVGRVAPTAGEIAWWVAESTAQGWSNFETRRVMLISAATFANDPTYSTQGAAAVALLGQTPTVVVNQVYTDIGRTDQTVAEVAYWVNQQAAEGWTNEVLRLTMLQSAASFVDNPIYQHNADLAITLLQQMAVEGCYALDIMTGKLTQVDMAGSAFFTDRVTDTLYTVKGNRVSAVFEGVSYRRSVYRTGVIKMGKAEPLAWLQVDSDYSSPVVVKWLGDGGVVRHTAVLMNNTPVRLPPGRFLEHEVEILSLARVTGVTLASTTQELQNV